MNLGQTFDTSAEHRTLALCVLEMTRGRSCRPNVRAANEWNSRDRDKRMSVWNLSWIPRPANERMRGTMTKGWVSLRQEKLEKGGSASKHRNLSSRPCGLTNPARQSLAGSRKQVLRGEG